jgi:hypothetical protein
MFKTVKFMNYLTIYECFGRIWHASTSAYDVFCFVRFLSSAFSNISFDTLIILSDSKILKWMKMKNRKKENDKRRRREKRIEPVQSSNIEFEHLIPVTNMSNLSFEEGQKQSF